MLALKWQTKSWGIFHLVLIWFVTLYCNCEGNPKLKVHTNLHQYFIWRFTQLYTG